MPDLGGKSYARGRLYRLMSLSLGVTTVAEVVSVAPVIAAQADAVPVSFAAVAVPVMVLPSLAALVVFRTAPLAALRRIWQVQALAMLAVYVALPITLGDAKIPAQLGLTWVGELEIIAACAAVLAWRARILSVYAVVWQVLMFAIAFGWCDDPWLGRAFTDALRQLFFVSMFGALAYALLRAGRILDAAVADVVREARQAASAEARRAARDRVQMLVHDRIIVALLAYVHNAAADREREEALLALDEIRHGAVDEGADRMPRELAWRLQSLTTRLDPAVRFDYTCSGVRPIPAEVGAAFEAALGEALRNSLRHAARGRTVNRQVRATVTDDHIQVVVLDDGEGFDPAKVDATRLGVRQSIVQRMQDLTGGRAEVTSRRGYGTTVSLSWSRP